MVEFQEERLVYRNIHKMSEDFVNWFFDEKAPDIPKHMHLVTAAWMWEGWKGREARKEHPAAWIVEGEGVPKHLTSDREYAYMYPERTTTPLYITPPAPAVPDAIITAPLDAMRCGPAASYVLGWNDCRAEVLGESR